MKLCRRHWQLEPCSRTGDCDSDCDDKSALFVIVCVCVSSGPLLSEAVVSWRAQIAHRDLLKNSVPSFGEREVEMSDEDEDDYRNALAQPAGVEVIS